jgi:hypothetical protein
MATSSPAVSSDSSPPSADEEQIVLPKYRLSRLVRCAIVGACFGSLCGVLTPVSPLFRRAFHEDKFGYRVVIHGALMSSVGSSLAYARWVDWGLTDPSFMPWMSPLHAQIPGTGAFFACQLSFPGLFTCMFEPSLKIALYEYARLTLKVFVAYHRIHIPVFIALSTMLGTIMYPLNRRKATWSAEEEIAAIRKRRAKQENPLSLR